MVRPTCLEPFVRDATLQVDEPPSKWSTEKGTCRRGHPSSEPTPRRKMGRFSELPCFMQRASPHVAAAVACKREVQAREFLELRRAACDAALQLGD